MPSAVFAGAARNCESFLPRTLATLERLASQYERVAFVFAVSDSDDNTLHLLRQWLAGRDGSVIDLGTLARRLPTRTQRIACARDECLEFIRRRGWTSYAELVMCDLDEPLGGPVDTAGYAAARAWLHASEDHGAAFANAFPAYYDIWALRHPTWCPYDCWHAIWGRRPSEPLMAAKIREVHARQIALPPHLPPITVRSAFGGMGLYKFACLGLTYYSDGVSGDGCGEWEQCEHVHFNSVLVDKGHELAVVPRLQVRAPTQHLFQYEGCPIKWQLRMLRAEMANDRVASRIAAHSHAYRNTQLS